MANPASLGVVITYTDTICKLILFNTITNSFIAGTNPISRDDFTFHSVASFVSLYRRGTLTPSQVAERVLIGIKSTADLRCVIKYNAKSVQEVMI